MRGKRSDRWLRLKSLSEASENQAAISLSHENAKLLIEKNRMQQLSDYVNAENTATPTTSALRFLRSRQFAARLNEAKIVQERCVHEAILSANKARKTWIAAREKSHRFEKLADKAAQIEKKSQHVNEMRVLDQAALARHNTRKPD